MCETIMEAVSLTKHFRSADKTWFTAVDGASISLQKGKTLGLLGQSGSGKSTLGQMMVGLLKPDSGELFFHGKLLSYPIRGQVRRRIQILFQHPEVSFNPQLTLRQSLVEPFKLMGKPFDDGAILSVIEPFGLHAEHLARYPGELSGGELQRAALARVTVLEPEMILLDEPTSMLDVITQAQMIDFLRRYQQQHQTAYLFITHSTALAEQFCDEIVKMEDGRLGTLEAPPQTPVGT
ncbi:MAG: ABC transporter ATP-binding protein [Christensenellales bacterium]